MKIITRIALIATLTAPIPAYGQSQAYLDAMAVLEAEKAAQAASSAKWKALEAWQDAKWKECNALLVVTGRYTISDESKAARDECLIPYWESVRRAAGTEHQRIMDEVRSGARALEADIRREARTEACLIYSAC